MLIHLQTNHDDRGVDEAKGEAQGKQHRKNFEENLHQANTARVGEGLPRIHEAKLTSTADDGGGDLATKRPIEGNNRVDVIGEKRGSNANHDDMSGDLDKNGQSKRQNEDSDTTSHKSGSWTRQLVRIGNGDDLVIQAEHVQGAAEEYRQDKAKLGCYSLQSNSWSELGPGAVGRDSPPPRCSLRLRNDSVYPGQGNARQCHLGNNMCQATRENRTSVGAQGEDAGEELTRKRPEHVDAEAAEAGPAASTGTQVGDSGAEAVGDGDRLNFEEVCPGRRIIVLLVRVVIVVIDRDEDG